MSKNKEKINSDFIKTNPLIFKKYKPLNIIGRGSFGNVYLGINIITKQYVAIKSEPRTQTQQFLESEAYLLYILKGYGIPEILSYGRTKNYNVLIQTLLGKSLLQLCNEREHKFTLNDVCLIGIQILDRIEWIHSKNYIHRDIKPENFLIGKNDPNTIYIIDFGLCKKYRSNKSGKHLVPRSTGKINGSVKYLSIYSLKGKEAGRRDDIISIGYVLIIFLLGDLPWGNSINCINEQQYNQMLYKREKITPEELCRGLPKQFSEYVKYSYNMTFEQKPDYDYLRSLFCSVLQMKNINKNIYVFSWLSKSQIKNCNKINPRRSCSNSKSNKRLKLIEKIEFKLKNRKNSPEVFTKVKILNRLNNNLSVKTKENLNSQKINKNNFKLIPFNRPIINKRIISRPILNSIQNNTFRNVNKLNKCTFHKRFNSNENVINPNYYSQINTYRNDKKVIRANSDNNIFVDKQDLNLSNTKYNMKNNLNKIINKNINKNILDNNNDVDIHNSYFNSCPEDKFKKLNLKECFKSNNYPSNTNNIFNYKNSNLEQILKSKCYNPLEKTNPNNFNKIKIIDKKENVNNLNKVYISKCIGSKGKKTNNNNIKVITINETNNVTNSNIINYIISQKEKKENKICNNKEFNNRPKILKTKNSPIQSKNNINNNKFK